MPIARRVTAIVSLREAIKRQKNQSAGQPRIRLSTQVGRTWVRFRTAHDVLMFIPGLPFRANRRDFERCYCLTTTQSTTIEVAAQWPCLALPVVNYLSGSDGMVAHSCDGIEVPKWRCCFNHLNERGDQAPMARSHTPEQSCALCAYSL